MPKKLEHNHQVTLFEWIELMSIRDPRFACIFAIPNGGYRHKWTAIALKREGVKPGVPDIFCACPAEINRKKYNGLFIELKIGANKPTELQLTWHRRLREQRYYVHVAYGFEDAQRMILFYLNIGRKNSETEIHRRC